MSDATYNGWTNYPTWAVHLWLTNDEQTQAQVSETVIADYTDEMERAKTLYPSWTEEEYRAYGKDIAASHLEDWVSVTHEDNDMTGRDMPHDLYTWALGQVNWHEIVRAFLED